MKRTSLLPTGAALLISLGILAAIPHAGAQQAENAFSLSSPGKSLEPAGTPAPNAENPSTAKADPNAPADTEILASKGANFDSKTRIAVFEGDVRVNDPRYQMACETLTVYLAATGAADGSKSPPKSNEQGGGGIDHATAQGRVIIIQRRAAAKPGEEAKVSVGRAERADFDNKTGDMMLSGNPSIEQDGSLHIATSPSTKMKLNRVGGLTTYGPSRTVFKNKGNAVDIPGSAPASSPAKPVQGDKKRRGANPAPSGQG